MKNKFKLFGIIAIIAIIGFSMAACDSGGDSSGGGGSGNTGGSGNNSLVGTKWVHEFEDGSTLFLSFTSATAGELGETNLQGQSKSEPITYTVSGTTITITSLYSGTISGTINGNQMTFISERDGTMIFKKVQ